MTDVTQHYEQLLAQYYTWMFGSFEEKVAEQQHLFQNWHITAREKQIAIDLGCGSGFQSIALAHLGFQVTAIDLSPRLLAELDEHKKELPIVTIQGDINNISQIVKKPVDIIICMGDTLTHLESKNSVINLLQSMHQLLKPDGRCILSFRDLAKVQQGLDRFIPVHSDNDTIMTCFLEYEPDRVIVHDLIYTRQNGQWVLHKSSYPKLRLALSWVLDHLQQTGFAIEIQEVQRGMCFVLAYPKK